ncbi:sensor histidine kinase [Maribacter polysiphoniae]|uniref:sensor histidine kinase n=1 Tax=Maribacter polysiphoniae TaxID=429344 RepID=UPI002352015A|nr:HAMP domain-containing sensor histidine kinase [Maribacter polysiphoniae]
MIKTVNKLKDYTIQFWVGLIAILLGLVVLLGWAFDIEVLMTIIPGYVSMKFNTALFFILSGGITISLIEYKSYKTIRFFSILLAVFAFISLIQDILIIDLGIDQFFINDEVALLRDDTAPGRPSPITSFCFILFGLVFFLIRSNRIGNREISQYGLHLISFLSFVAIIGYLFNVPSLYKLSFFTSMALHTSVTLFIMSVSTTMFNPKLGITGMFTEKQIGNVMALNLFRKILPAILVLGFIQLILSRLAIITVDFGIALFSTCFTLILLYALWSTKELLNKIDNERKAAQHKIKKDNINLESKIRERTKYLTTQNKQLEDFSYIISHNLRGPLGNLKSLLGFYREEESIEGKDQLMDYFHNTVDNLSYTLEDLMQVVTIRHSSKKEKTTLVFDNIFSKLKENFQGQIIESGAVVTSDFSEAPTIEYSSMYLESIMHNLLSNALKYRSKDRAPEIHFKSKNHSDKIELSVVDNGLGINLELHGHKLFGLHKTFHKHPEAKGVGLFITKAQVEAMGGEITVQSQVNKGATFEIIF